MRASEFLISTLKETPADAEVVSHSLMLRAGMIKRLAAGIYTYLPMGLRVIRRIESIIREEMNRAGAIEMLMPVVQPAELWMESGRWDKMGPELLRLKDRHDRDFIVQPTSEEVVVDTVRDWLRSYKQLPVNLYHIQTKFRDERRPRFGVMRGREFTMKDAYSFDRDDTGAMASYKAMYDAYCRIFERMGLGFRAVAADTGNIGGQASHEFQVIADTGEDAIVYCPTSDYAANMELAEAVAPAAPRAAATQPLTKTPTPGKEKCEDVAALLKIPLSATVKSVVLAVEREGGGAQIWLLLIRGDHELNEVKVGKVPGLDNGFRFATEAEIIETFGCKPGYLGPIGMRKPVEIVADRTVAAMSDFVTGANAEDFHYTGVNWGRDIPEPAYRMCATSSRATHPRTARACSPSSAASKSATCSQACRIPRRCTSTSSTKTASRAPRRWAATASASHACSARPSNRTTTTRASSGPPRSRPSPWRSRRSACASPTRCARRPNSSTRSCAWLAWTCCSTIATSGPA